MTNTLFAKTDTDRLCVFTITLCILKIVAATETQQILKIKEVLHKDLTDWTFNMERSNQWESL